MTCSTVAATIIKVGIQKIIGMALGTMGFGRLPCASFPTPDIFSLSYRLKMGRIYTQDISAKVVESKTTRNGANQEFIGEAMSFDFLTITPRISISAPRCSPRP